VSGTREPVLLERESYRRRRVRDAARFLPFLGVVLVFFPALWTPEAAAEEAAGTAQLAFYVFSVWFALIAMAVILSRQLMRTSPPETGADGGPEAG